MCTLPKRAQQAAHLIEKTQVLEVQSNVQHHSHTYHVDRRMCSVCLRKRVVGWMIGGVLLHSYTASES